MVVRVSTQTFPWKSVLKLACDRARPIHILTFNLPSLAWVAEQLPRWAMDGVSIVADSEIAFSSGCDTHVIRLLADEATCIARAKSDQTRPVSSRQYWQKIVAHWFRDFEPIDLTQELLSSYH